MTDVSAHEIGDDAGRENRVTESGREGRVFLHVGALRAGTGIIQGALWHNRHTLAERGVHYPLESRDEHFAAAMDLREMAWDGHRDPAWSGAWDAVAERIGRRRGQTAIFSDERLAVATPEQIRRALSTLPAERVHVVFTAGDPARQLVAEWQQRLIRGHALDFAEFVEQTLADRDAVDGPGKAFWLMHDPVRVLRRWQTAVPPERLHLITLPHGDDRNERLWIRFAELTGIDLSWCDLTGVDDTVWLGAVEAGLLSMLNKRVGPALGDTYKRLIGEHVVRPVLARRRDPVPVGLPERHYGRVRELAQEMITTISEEGWQVIGDLSELAPRFGEGGRPDLAPAEQMLEAGIEVIESLLVGITGMVQQTEMAHLNHELSQVRDQLKRLAETSAQPHPAWRLTGRLLGRRRV